MKSPMLIVIMSCCISMHGRSNEAMSTADTIEPSVMEELVVWAYPSDLSLNQKPFTLVEPFAHYHLSRLGAPYIYSFTTRPAFTGRDLFANYGYRKSDHYTEQEYEIELSWALTQQIGIIAEIPYIIHNTDGAAAESDYGDLTLAPYASIFETDRLLIALQTEFGLPTGNDILGNQTTIAPGITSWVDLGNWFTLNSQIAIQHGFKSEETALKFSFGFIKSHSGKFAHACIDGECDHSGDQSQFNYHLEVLGDTPINGNNRGDFYLEGLIGMSFNISDNYDIRAGYLFPLSSPKEFDHGFTTGLIFQF